ncbi:MAG: tetratricopeptide repeat protein [Chlorobi bacterium]|nr:tetratricopeptide repeat protein [Chlorobiota bacterium]
MNNREEETTLPTFHSTKESPSSNGSHIREYATAGIICFVVSFLVYIVAKPEERKGPPQGNTERQTGLPSNHPDVDTSKMNVVLEQLQRTRATLEAHPDNPMAHLDLANILYDAGQIIKDPTFFAEALLHYEFYLNQYPDDPNARTDFAYALYRTGNLNDAIAELYKVQQSSPRHQNSAFNLALMYKEKDRPDSVLAYMERVVIIDSTTRVGKAAKEILDTYHGAH